MTWRASLIAFSIASAPPSVKKTLSMSPGRISASFAPSRARGLGREGRLDVLELGRLGGDGVDHPPVAVADVDRHQLAVEVEDPLAFGRVQVDPLGVVDGDRVEGALDATTRRTCAARDRATISSLVMGPGAVVMAIGVPRGSVCGLRAIVAPRRG